MSPTRNALGWRLSLTDPNGHVTSYAYWDASRDGALKSVTRPAIQNENQFQKSDAIALKTGRSRKTSEAPNPRQHNDSDVVQAGPNVV